MDEAVAQALKIVRLLWFRRWLVLGIALLVCVVGWPLVYMVPNKYDSMARVYLNTQTMLTPLLRGLAVEDGNARDRLASTTRRTLLSRPNLEKVIRETDMDLRVHGPEEMERLLVDLASRIEVKGSQRENIYTISYTDQDPKLAKKVVETLLTLFVESTLGVARNDTSVTERFIEEQIAEYEARLVAAEERLKEFKQANMGLMPSDTGGYFTRLQADSDRLQRAQLELREASRRRDELQRQMQDEAIQHRMHSVLEEQSNIYDARISAMESRLDELLLQFTDVHPDVVSLKASIQELKRQKQEEIAKQGELSRSGDGVSDSIVAEELRVALSTVEAEVSALQVRVDEYQQRVNHLKSMVDTIPKVEAEYARLNRDYSINLQNYEALVNRRESAKISREADQSVDDLQFKIIDPPVEPIVPSGPNRPLLLSAVLILGLGLGGGIAWGLSIIRPTFYEQGELREFSGLPVLGTVTLVMDDKQLLRRKLSTLGFVLISFLLFSAYGAQVVLQIMS